MMVVSQKGHHCISQKKADKGIPSNHHRSWVMSGMDDSEQENDEVSSSSEASWEEEEDDNADKDLLWLCEEGMLELALNKVRAWDEEEENSSLQEQHLHDIFKTNADGNTALHEILMGGSNEAFGTELVERLLRRVDSADPQRRRALLERRPPSHSRTLLHWAAWGKCDADVAKHLIRAHPQGLVVTDGPRHGRRTPVEIAQRYWPDAPVARLLERCTTSYRHWECQYTIHLCVNRLLGGRTAKNSKPLSFEPHLQKTRNKSMLAANIIGYALQREMMGLALHILSFCGARTTAPRKKKRKRTTRVTAGGPGKTKTK